MQLEYLFFLTRSKNLRKCFEGLDIDNIKFPPTIRDIEQFDKDNPDISYYNICIW